MASLSQSANNIFTPTIIRTSASETFRYRNFVTIPANAK